MSVLFCEGQCRHRQMEKHFCSRVAILGRSQKINCVFQYFLHVLLALSTAQVPSVSSAQHQLCIPQLLVIGFGLVLTWI